MRAYINIFLGTQHDDLQANDCSVLCYLQCVVLIVPVSAAAIVAVLISFLLLIHTHTSTEALGVQLKVRAAKHANTAATRPTFTIIVSCGGKREQRRRGRGTRGGHAGNKDYIQVTGKLQKCIQHEIEVKRLLISQTIA